MSIWQSPYRPPPIRSRAVVRPHRSGASGDVEGGALQPITPPDIIPLKRGFWAAYGKQTLACAAGLFMSLFFVWGSWIYTTEPDAGYEGVVLVVMVHPRPSDYWENGRGWQNAMEERNWELRLTVYAPDTPERDAATVYTWLAAIIALVMLLIPLFFYSRWRKMEKIFGAEMYDSTEGETEPGSESQGDSDEPLSSEELQSLHPNRGVVLDGTQVGLTALLLVCTAAVQGVAESMILFVDTPSAGTVGKEVWELFAAGLLLQAVLNLCFVVTTLSHTVGTPRLAFYMSCAGALFSLITVSLPAIAICATGAAILWRSHMAFKMMLARVAEPEKKDPLEAYYHNLLQLLVWVMRADGHADRRELRKINTTCDAMNLSAWERDVVIASANLDDRKDLRSAAERYLAAAKEASIADAANGLVVVASAVAGADGVIAKNEATAVRELAKLVGVTDDHAGQILLQQQLHLEALDSPRAHELLHLAEGATEAQVQAAYRALADELEVTRYQFIGTTLAEQVQQRHTMLDRARDLLLKEATA